MRCAEGPAAAAWVDGDSRERDYPPSHETAAPLRTALGFQTWLGIFSEFWEGAKVKAIVPTAATLRKYGVTKADYLDMYVRQEGNCGLCGKPQRKRPFVIDHDHESGEVRGLLHAPCNFALGYYEAGMFESYFQHGSINNALFQHGRAWAMGLSGARSGS